MKDRNALPRDKQAEADKEIEVESEVTTISAELKPGERKIISGGSEGPVVEIIKRSGTEAPPRSLMSRRQRQKYRAVNQKKIAKLRRQESNMTTISATMVKQLREKTGAGMMDCKQALVECDADIDKAVDFLRKKGLATARKRAGRTMSEGTIQSYIHMGGKLGVLVEVNCETDFVAKNEDFVNFAKNIAMHIAATNPLSIQAEDVPEEIVNREKEIYKSQALETGKPENVITKIVDGKMKKFFTENCLLKQAYVRDPDLTVEDLLNELIAKIGENITIRRFVRFQTGEQ